MRSSTINTRWKPIIRFVVLILARKHVWAILAFCLCFLLLAPAVLAQKQAINRTHKHVLADDGVKDPSFALMRDRLLLAIKNHDKSFIEEILSADIATALGGGSGKEYFEKQWQDFSMSSPFWARLQRVLLHGAQLDSESNEYHAPAVSFDDSHSELPQAVIWNKSAALHKLPDDAAPFCLLYDQQITIIEPSKPAPVESKWAKIVTADGSKGFLKATDFYSAYDEFAVFKKSQGKWTLSWFGYAGL